MDNLKRTQENCIGCGLCHSMYGTELKKNEDGYMIPTSNLSDLASLCPNAFYERQENFELWGKWENVYAGYSTDPQIRYAASSGGVLTALSIYFIENHVVDGIIHTGVDLLKPQSTQTFVSRTKEDVLSHMGSRYCVSSPLYDVLDILGKDSTKKYAFIGRPCDVTALKIGMNTNDQLKSQIVFTMSFFCAGIPSDTINKELLQVLGCPEDELKSFQYRGNGWPGYTTAVDKQGKKYQISYQKAWGDYLGRHVKKICRYCMDGIGEVADISAADLWYLDEHKKPDFSEHDGRNILFARTPEADAYLRDVAQKGYLELEDFITQMDDFYLYQPHQFMRRTTMKYRLLPLRFFGKYAPKYSRKRLNEASTYATKAQNWSTLKGTIKRILQGKV